MNNHHDAVSLNYTLDVTDTLALNILGYNNHFKRNWFKSGVAKNLIKAANAGDTTAQSVLDGDQDYQDMTWTNGNRSYDSYGVEVNAGIDLAAHFIEIGVRDHTDKMDRYQLKEVFDQVNGSLVFDSFIRTAVNWTVPVRTTVANGCPARPLLTTSTVTGKYSPVYTKDFRLWVAALKKTKSRKPAPITRRVCVSTKTLSLSKPLAFTATLVTRRRCALLPTRVQTAPSRVTMC